MVHSLENLTMATLPKVIYKSSTILIKIPAGFFAEINMLVWELQWKCTRSRKVKQSWKLTKLEDTLSNFKTTIITTKIGQVKTSWYWHGKNKTYIHTYIHTYTLIYIYIRESGWLSWVRIWLQLRSWSNGLWVQAPHWTLCYQHSGCFRSPLSLLIPSSCSLSKINT